MGQFSGGEEPAGEDNFDAHVDGPVCVADLVLGEHLEKAAGGIGSHGNETADQLADLSVVDGIRDEGKSPGSVPGELDQDNALKSGAAAATKRKNRR